MRNNGIKQLIRTIPLSLAGGIKNNLAQMFNIMKGRAVHNNPVAASKVKVLLPSG
jgi:hypothetical protein